MQTQTISWLHEGQHHLDQLTVNGNVFTIPFVNERGATVNLNYCRFRPIIASAFRALRQAELDVVWLDAVGQRLKEM